MNVYEYEEHDPLDKRQASDAEGRLTVHNILASYHGNYDLYAEAVQNAVDAVHLRWLAEDQGSYTPEITVIVDLPENTFTVIDNGVGIPPQACLSVFAPNFSLKSRLVSEGGRRLRGHKGVGATFLAYGFERTELASKDAEGTLFTGRLNGGRRWAEGAGDRTRPLLNPYAEESREFNDLERGTLIRIKCGAGTRPAQLSQYGTDVESWVGNLRAETAIGMIHDVVDGDFDPQVTLRLIQTSGRVDEQMTCRYLFPHDLLDDDRFLDMQAYKNSGRWPDVDPRDSNKEGIYRIYSDEQIRAEFSELEPHFPKDASLWLYVFRAYSATFFADRRGEPRGRRLYPGVRLAADSMPIGSIQNIRRLSRFTYSQNTVHVLLHVEGAEPDIGRKGFSENVEELGQLLAKELVEQELQKWNQFLRSETSTRRSEAALEDWKFASRTHEREAPLPPWPGVPLRIVSTPEREQDVIALFHELLGAQAILGYDVLSTSQHAKYDSLMWVRLQGTELEHATFDPRECVWGLLDYRAQALTNAVIEAVEYKLDLLGLVRDLRSGAKSFTEIRLAIVWTAGERFEGHVTDYELTKLSFPEDLDLRHYPAQTHEFRSASERGVIAVIVLEDLFEAVGT